MKRRKLKLANICFKRNCLLHERAEPALWSAQVMIVLLPVDGRCEELSYSLSQSYRFKKYLLQNPHGI